jgi:hypothetical protein
LLQLCRLLVLIVGLTAICLSVGHFLWLGGGVCIPGEGPAFRGGRVRATWRFCDTIKGCWIRIRGVVSWRRGNGLFLRNFILLSLRFCGGWFLCWVIQASINVSRSRGVKLTHVLGK